LLRIFDALLNKFLTLMMALSFQPHHPRLHRSPSLRTLPILRRQCSFADLTVRTIRAFKKVLPLEATDVFVWVADRAKAKALFEHLNR
jgi:hypothetical protein